VQIQLKAIVVPPKAQVPAIFTAVLSTLPLLSTLDHIDVAVKVVQELVVRDEKLSEADGKMKLGDKLTKWLTNEVEKSTGSSKT
jgi:hypothetical protein